MSYIDDESNDCMLYVRHNSTNKTWTCHLCNLTEIEIEGIVWDNYQLACGHETHMRCYRVWSKMMGAVGCAECGLKELIKENECCYYCGKWGHSTDACTNSDRN